MLQTLRSLQRQAKRVGGVHPEFAAFVVFNVPGDNGFDVGNAVGVGYEQLMFRAASPGCACLFQLWAIPAWGLHVCIVGIAFPQLVSG